MKYTCFWHERQLNDLHMVQDWELPLSVTVMVTYNSTPIIQTGYELLHFFPLICSYQKACTSCTDHQNIGLVNRLHNFREKTCESSPLLAQWRDTHLVSSCRDTCTGEIKYFISFIIRSYFVLQGCWFVVFFFFISNRTFAGMERC